MTVIQYIRDFIKTCPHLDEFHKGIGVDYLRPDTKGYMIETVPAEPILQRFTDGGTIRQLAFHFASRERYGSNVLEQLDNIGFYEHFAKWMEQKTWDKALPVFDAERIPLEMIATTDGYLYSNETDLAQYIIQCNFKYKQEALK